MNDGRLADRVLGLSARADAALREHPRTAEVADRLPRADDNPLRIAFSGPYSAGKTNPDRRALRVSATPGRRVGRRRARHLRADCLRLERRDAARPAGHAVGGGRAHGTSA
ncbi:MAG: hypothetical protein QM621_02750 [Aeromicrobium sp.]|uniref:hypothetical protein n=1 Tax=Aeromicrobium sp. TaxID=1871063 RepID=UPI0039E43E43